MKPSHVQPSGNVTALSSFTWLNCFKPCVCVLDLAHNVKTQISLLYYEKLLIIDNWKKSSQLI